MKQMWQEHIVTLPRLFVDVLQVTVQHPLKCELLKLRSLIFTRNYVLFQIVFITRINWYFVSTWWIWQVWSKCPGVLYLAFSEISWLYNWIYKIKNQFTYFWQKIINIKYTATFFRPEKLMFNMNVFLDHYGIIIFFV